MVRPGISKPNSLLYCCANVTAKSPYLPVESLIDLLINQSIDQSIDQSINQSIVQAHLRITSSAHNLMVRIGVAHVQVVFALNLILREALLDQRRAPVGGQLGELRVKGVEIRCN